MLGRRTTLAALAALACLNFIVRYPVAGHEVGVDSFVWHGMATSIQRNGFALWVLNPLSYVGLYPLSHPSGSPFLLVAFSDLWGGPIEGSVLYVDMVVALLSMLAAFVLGWEFSHTRMFGLLAATILSLTPELITALTWQVPTRIFFTVLLPILLWGLIRFARRPAKTLFVVVAATFFLMMSFHRLTILVSLIGLAYVGTGIFITVMKTIRIRSPRIFLAERFVRWAPIFAVTSVGLVSVGTLVTGNVLEEYSIGVLISGNSKPVQLFNLGVSLARNSGVLLPLAVLGIVGVCLRRNKSYAEPLVVVALLAFLPMLFLRQYTGYYTVPFTSLFIAFGLVSLLKRIRSPHRRLVGTVIIAGFVLLSSAAISGYDLIVTSHMQDDTYNTATFVRYYTTGTIITNEGLVGSRIHAISSASYLPVGGATTSFQSPELLMFGFVDPGFVIQNVAQVPPGQLTVDSDSFFVLPGIQAENDWATIMESSVDGVSPAYGHYHVMYALESKNLLGEYAAYGNVYDSLLMRTALEFRYKVFENGQSTMFYLG